MIEVRKVMTKREKEFFLTFPWRMYKDDPLWYRRSSPSAERPPIHRADYSSRMDMPISSSPGKMEFQSVRSAVRMKMAAIPVNVHWDF